MTQVTRVTIGGSIDGVFMHGPVSRDDLIEAARANGAPADVLSALERLRGSSYRELRDLWRELSDVPVGRPELISSP